MGNTQSSSQKLDKDIANEQGISEELSGIELDTKIYIGCYFCMEIGSPTKEGIYQINIYYYDKFETTSRIYSFQSFHSLKPRCTISVEEFPFVKLTFETELFEIGLTQHIIVSVDFSSSFKCLEDFGNRLESMPLILHPDRKMNYLYDRFWYYIILIDPSIWKIRIVSSSNEGLGFESTFQEGDIVIEEYAIKSFTTPLIKKTENDKFIIFSESNGFKPVEINLPSDEISIADLLLEEEKNSS
jgi:hypothetical protein